MPNKNLVLKEKFTFELLYFVWKNLSLKRFKFRTIYLSKEKINKSIPFSWLKRVVYLVNKGKFKYFMYFTKFSYAQNCLKKSLKILKFSILETAFFLILRPFFSDYLSFNYLNLKEILRLL